MSDERPDPYLLIGLHKLAETQGDGLVPEFHGVLPRLPLPEVERPSARILPFPFPAMGGKRRAPAEGGAVIPFRALRPRPS